MARGPAEMPFLDHLEELRWRLIWSLVALGVATAVGLLIVSKLDVIGVLERPIRQLLPDQKLLFTSPTTPFLVTLKLAFLVGLVLAIPFVAYQVWGFLAPALKDEERKYVIPAIWVSFGLFLAGIAMAYFLVLPLGLRFLLGIQSQSLSPIITIDEYLKFATRMLLGFGIIFELPVIMVVLAAMGVVTPEFLKKYRRHALVVLAALSALLTPPDVGTMLMMMTPLFLLYETSIWLVRLVTRARRRRPEGAAEETAG
ncbi:MAG TPA: twin-arginine translocase subunit TatC [Gemmatimonadota bacterium]|nr:twin-arginine translocase subunit TatC [Gemmatimonadota bacterium]